ncbi:hypothetical protein [Henriciella sp.]|uniref:TraR/DksA family transcriptional regulator n=1 Tax=Henriciella sp. TaxID=1968823 RepID=UPI00263360AE|nr:hypothetical protein [Henriciella sp.]
MKSYSGLGPSGHRKTGDASLGHNDDRETILPARNDLADLKRIDNALRRLDTGRFGHCLYCGDQISMSRLNFDPAVESCGTCAEDEAAFY